MASKRHLRRREERRREHECLRKKPISAHYAKVLVRRLREEGEMGIRAYRCPHCGRLHLGHGWLSRGDFV